MKIPNILQNISSHLHNEKAKAVIVGGCVRDHFLKLPSKDIDIEVYGLASLEELENILSQYGSVNIVGKSFGVLKFTCEAEEYDFSFPRTEQKVAEGHRGFDVKADGTLSYGNAAARRDFTVNALGYDIESKQFLDPFGGIEDIKSKKLRHIDDVTFIEDPLRVYRAVQFCARFGFTLAYETFVLCKQMVEEGLLEELPKERVYEEWKKLLLKAPNPSLGFNLMRNLGIVERYYPELYALIDVPQSPKWHPEGDVWIHTLMTVDEMAILIRSEALQDRDKKKKLQFMFAIFCHDLGKAVSTTVDNKGDIRSIGHENTGLACTKNFMYRLTNEHDFIESILPFVKHHLKPSQFYRDNSSDKAIRKLATMIYIEDLIWVAKADFLGRTTKEALSREYKAGDWLLKRSKILNVSIEPLANILQGKDLLTLGLLPSPRFKVILDAVYEKQLDGSIVSKEDAINYVEEFIKEEPS